MIFQRDVLGIRITLNPDETIDIQPEFARPFDPLGDKQPPELAAISLGLPVSEVLRAFTRGFIPSTQDESGLRVAVLRDVAAGVRRLREETSR